MRWGDVERRIIRQLGPMLRGGSFPGLHAATRCVTGSPKAHFHHFQTYPRMTVMVEEGGLSDVMVHFVSYEDYPSAVRQREQGSSDAERLQKPLGLASTVATHWVRYPVLSRFRLGLQQIYDGKSEKQKSQTQGVSSLYVETTATLQYQILQLVLESFIRYSPTSNARLNLREL